MPNKRAFEKFYAEHLDKVYRFVFFRCSGNTEQTEDLVSEIFMKALEHFDSYDSAKSTSAWIMTITRNHLANYWRDTKPTAPLPEAGEDDAEVEDRFWLTSAQRVFKKESHKALAHELLAELSPSEARIVTFHYLLGYSYSEIAEFESTSEGAIKVAVHRVIKKLRSIL
jgi:RNA polymerase sigma-70 factor (ECF subfamily)